MDTTQTIRIRDNLQFLLRRIVNQKPLLSNNITVLKLTKAPSKKLESNLFFCTRKHRNKTKYRLVCCFARRTQNPVSRARPERGRQTIFF